MANISKLNSDQISEMRRLFEEGATQKSLAAKYNVSISTVIKKLKAKDEPKVEAIVIELAEPMMVQLKKKEPPKRRIVGVNV